MPEREEHLRGRDRALVQADKLVPELVLRDRVPRAVLVAVERDRELHVGAVARGRAVEVHAHVLLRPKLHLLLPQRRTQGQSSFARARYRAEYTHRQVDDVEDVEGSEVERALGVRECERALWRRREVNFANEEPTDEAFGHREAWRGKLLGDVRWEGVTRRARARREPEAVPVEAVERVLDRLDLAGILLLDRRVVELRVQNNR